MTTLHLRGAWLCPLFLLACQFHARDADSYRKDTRALLETKQNYIQNCYQMQLPKDPQLGGTVVLKFTVQKESGKIANATVDPSSTAPAALSNCVVQAINGLTLDPPDARDGNATFRWEFKAEAAAPPAA